MKIGIITWFHFENYGTKLQAIALQQYLRMLGHNAELINFKLSPSRKSEKTPFPEKLKRQPHKYAMVFARRRFSHEIEQRSVKLKHAIDEYCILTEEIQTEAAYISICNKFDLIICGSDQIWNPNCYHRYYYADFPEIKVRRVSYAPSLGVNAIPEQISTNMKQSILKFEAISVREQKGAELLEKLIGIRPDVVVDPTMLLTKEEWTSLLQIGEEKSERYVVCLFLTDNRNHWRAAKQFSKKNHLKMRIIPYWGFSYFKRGSIYANAGVEDFVSLIKNAEYVLTDSFHAAVFSLIFQKQFLVFQRFREDDRISQNSRIQNLLELAGVESSLLGFGTSSISKIPDINYEKVTERLEKKILDSKHFLSLVLKK